MPAHTLDRKTAAASWTLQIAIAVILGQTLFFKFTGAPEARALFETLGAEPWGRWATGVLELAVVILILRRSTAVYGALLAAGAMVGAIGAHVTKLGIEVEGDGGLLFGMAVAALLFAGLVLGIRRAELPLIGPRLAPARARASLGAGGP